MPLARGEKAVKAIIVVADILACLLDLNFKQSKLTRLIFSKLTLLKIDAYFA
jgi:hypothetical protein